MFMQFWRVPLENRTFPKGEKVIIADANTKPAAPNDSDKLSVVVNWAAALRKK
jgi:hypothetical protein